MSNPPRVLVIAEAANPEWVSVPLVGWSLATALGAEAQTHIVTQIRNRDAFLRAGLVEGEDFTAIDSEAVSRPLYKLANILRMGKGRGWTMVTAIGAIAYPYFEHLVWKTFGADIRAGKFDIVHRVTPLTPTTVSPIAAKCARAGVPFVLGPINGGVPWPKGFDAERRREREWLSYVRGLYKALPGRRRMYESTAAILTGSRHTASEIPARFADKCVWIPENAIDPERFNRTAAAHTDGPLRGVFIGRLVPYKGPDMLLEAAQPLLADGRMTLDIIGDGPMRGDLEARAKTLGIAETVTFHGQLDHHAVQDVAAECHLMTFPSIREFGGGVVLEAMALGVVPVIVDYAGPGELVDDTTGYKVPIGSRADIIAAFQNTLTEIAEDPTAIKAKAAAARARVVQDFLWPSKAAQVRQVYDWVLGHRPDRPQPVEVAR
ncbi:MAG: glycosyltransferase [Pseudomonadota bacterium]